jgi:cytochrome P450
MWGPDALEFNPVRWLPPVSEERAEQALMTPPRDTYIRWSVGPRVCPEQNMSQVEFVSAVAKLFLRCSVRPKPGRGRVGSKRKADC